MKRLKTYQLNYDFENQTQTLTKLPFQDCVFTLRKKKNLVNVLYKKLDMSPCVATSFV